MFAALRVSQVGAIVLVDCKAKPAFEGANVVFEKVGVFVEVDGFEGEFAEAFAPVCVGAGRGGYSASAELGAGSVL